MQRLDKLLASTGLWSRREAKGLVKAGRVRVGGVKATAPDEKYDASDRIEVDGEWILCEKYRYFMVNKPAGLLSATRDSRQDTVLELLPAHLRRIGLFPVGRLDKDTEGLLLLTNDGELAHRLISPKKHVDKTYYVRTDGPFSQQDVEAFRQGMTLKDGLICMPAGLELLPEKGEAIVTLREGKYHQIKRMTAARGRKVLYLKRLSIGPLALDPSLAAGAYRPLTSGEQAVLLQNEKRQ